VLPNRTQEHLFILFCYCHLIFFLYFLKKTISEWDPTADVSHTADAVAAMNCIVLFVSLSRLSFASLLFAPSLLFAHPLLFFSRPFSSFRTLSFHFSLFSLFAFLDIKQDLAQFFVSEVRKNNHSFPTPEAEESSLIYNFQPSFTEQLTGDLQTYYF
jgi:hypothetical protein